jgi:oligopeptide transport system permease protein
LTVLCVAGPWFLRATYQEQNLDLGATPPSAAHWLGTDTLGRDLLVRLLYGGRISIGVGLCATLVALTIGVVYGAVAGYLGGKADAVMMRLVDIIYALPFTIFVILLMVFFGRNIFLLFFAIGAVEWLTMARIVRSQIMTTEEDGVHRGRPFARLRAQPHHLPPSAAQRPRPDHCLRHAHHPGCHAARGLPQLPRPRCPAAHELVGHADQGRRREDGGVLVAARLPRHGVFSLTLFSLNFLGDGLRDALDVRAAKD